jgi:hypothetical protein
MGAAVLLVETAEVFIATTTTGFVSRIRTRNRLRHLHNLVNLNQVNLEVNRK